MCGYSEHILQRWYHTPTASCQRQRQDRCVAVCCGVFCGVLRCVAVCCSVLQWLWLAVKGKGRIGVLQCVAVCCGVLRCVAVCCSVLQCVAASCQRHRQDRYIAVCCSVLQCVAVYCIVVQFVGGVMRSFLLQEAQIN